MSNPRFFATVAQELGIETRQVASVAALLEDGATVPFIARYRKEATGSLDEVAVTAVRDRLEQLRDLETRREAILKSLQENGHLTPALEGAVRGASTLAALEDLYLPFRPRRRTRATAAREKGLEPLALLLLEQDPGTDPSAEAAPFVDPEKGVADPEEALAGARDILAERISEDVGARERMRELFRSRGVLRSRLAAGKEEAGAKFRDYFQWEEAAASAPSHRVLAIRRGEKEGALSFSVLPPEEDALALLSGLFLKGGGAASDQVRCALEDGYRRLLAPSMETEIRLEMKKAADAEAIRVFAGNLRELLLAPPLGSRGVLAVDPGLRTGCKTVCLGETGELLETAVFFLGQGEAKERAAADLVRSLAHRHRIGAVAVGNGTGGREAEAFLRALGLPGGVPVVMVNESGASIYSASEAAREEFPDLDLTFRGAVSIGRRLQDPLAELVKIDPKSIGVGQYQHDVDQRALKGSLDDTVVSCVNGVGVEVNTASRQLLGYVSGLGPQLAANIVAFREERGVFTSREQLREVPRLGPKAFEQAAGFLRIRGGSNPLDASAVHPERYRVVKTMAEDLGCAVQDLLDDPALRGRVRPERYLSGEVGLPTLTDILQELARPGRDPRAAFEAFSFAEGVEELKDLQPGMVLPGVVTNVTAFGAFVDVGVHQDGLVHVSQMADRFVRDPSQVARVGQKVTVRVLEVDLQRCRISLTMRSGDPGKGREEADSPRESQRDRRGGRPRGGEPRKGRGWGVSSS